MYLTKASLRRGAGRMGAIAAQLLDAAEHDLAHRLVWTLFSETGNETRDFLYRQIEPGEFLVLSERAPEDPGSIWDLVVRPFAPEFRAGDRMRFLLRANPAETVRRAGTKRGVRVDAVMNAKRPRSERGDRSFDAEDEQSAALRWLFKRADRFGVRFEEPACRVDAYRVERLSRGFHRREDDTRFAVVDYQGELEVTSPERLSEALRGGIGKAKAYGCGLLLVRPA